MLTSFQSHMNFLPTLMSIIALWRCKSLTGLRVVLV